MSLGPTTVGFDPILTTIGVRTTLEDHQEPILKDWWWSNFIWMRYENYFKLKLVCVFLCYACALVHVQQTLKIRRPILTHAESWHTSQESHIMTIYDVKNYPILQVSSQEPSTSSKYDFEDINVLQVWLRGRGGSWGTSKHARELKFGTQVKNYISGRSTNGKWCWEMGRRPIGVGRRPTWLGWRPTWLGRRPTKPPRRG